MQGSWLLLHASFADQQQYQKAAYMLRLLLAIQEGSKESLDDDIAEDVCELITCIGQGVSAHQGAAQHTFVAAMAWNMRPRLAMLD